jgi:antitoxin CptB
VPDKTGQDRWRQETGAKYPAWRRSFLRSVTRFEASAVCGTLQSIVFFDWRRVSFSLMTPFFCETWLRIDTMTDLEMRKRRAVWRANHRGTKELDILLGRYADASLAAMTAPDLEHFETFLEVSEAELQSWLLAPRLTADDKYSDLVTAVRSFHGMT